MRRICLLSIPRGRFWTFSWTLCLEVQFYLTFLFILVFGHHVGLLPGPRRAALRRTVVTVAVAAVGVWSLIHSVRQPSSDFAGWSWTFFLGVAVYAGLTRGIPAAAVVAPLAVLAAWFAALRNLDGLVSIATAAAIYAAGASGRLSTLLARRPLLYLGRISYSLYLLHMVLGMNLLFLLAPTRLGGIAGGWFALGLAIAISLCGADLLHRIVEAPSNRLSRRLKQSARPRELPRAPVEPLAGTDLTAVALAVEPPRPEGPAAD